MGEIAEARVVRIRARIRAEMDQSERHKVKGEKGRLCKEKMENDKESTHNPTDKIRGYFSIPILRISRWPHTLG